jgi:hypothetical protein
MELAAKRKICFNYGAKREDLYQVIQAVKLFPQSNPHIRPCVRGLVTNRFSRGFDAGRRGKDHQTQYAASNAKRHP